MKIIVIGGIAAGMSAAAKMRRLDNKIEITVYEKGIHVSYAACGLPYYISDKNMDYKSLISREVKDFEKNNINIELKNEVVKVIPEENKLLIRDIEKNTIFTDFYDKLFVGVGAAPIQLDVKGRESINVFTLKTIEDADKIKKYVNREEVENVTIIGGGYIGIELAETMVKLNKKVRIVEYSNQILNTFEKELVKFALNELHDKNVIVNTGEQVLELISNDKTVRKIRTSKGIYDTDMVLMCVGIRPNTDFLKDSDIDLDKKGSIIIDREMRTSIDNIYAAGDCAVVYHKVMKKNRYIPLGTTANKMGRLAAENMLGENNQFIGTLGSSAIRIFDWQFARTGISELEAQEMNVDYDTKLVTTYTNAKYFSDSKNIYIKIIFDKKTKKILGVQSAGQKDVVMRIDVFAAAIHNEMTADQLGMLDLCYSPPFSSVWDAVNIAGNVIK